MGIGIFIKSYRAEEKIDRINMFNFELEFLEKTHTKKEAEE